MGTTLKLTAASVKAKTKPGLYNDGLGLYLQVSAFDTKSWIFRYAFDGKARKMGLGAVHTVSLADARLRAAEARRKLLDDVDPIAERERARDARRGAETAAKVEAAKARTFKEVADSFVAANRAGWKNAKHADQ